MFNWLGNLFPYSDLHSLNLDWILSKMKETAAQAAKAIADSANALAQVIEAKTAAQNAQTAATDAQNKANEAATSAANAENYASQASGVIERFPIQSGDIASGAVTPAKLQYKAGVLSTTNNTYGATLTIVDDEPVANIGNQLTNDGFLNFINASIGDYLQARVSFYNGAQILNNIHCSISTFYWLGRTSPGSATYAPLVFVDDNTGSKQVIHGYAQIKHVTSSGFAFQMFFDSAPTLSSAYTFRVQLRNVGTVLSDHF